MFEESPPPDAPHLPLAAEDPETGASTAADPAATASKSAFAAAPDDDAVTLSTDERQADAASTAVDGPETVANSSEQGPHDDEDNEDPSEELLRRLAMTNSKLTASNSALEADLDRIDGPEEEDEEADGPDDVQPPLADARNAAAHTAAAAADSGPAAGFGATFGEPASANGVSPPSGVLLMAAHPADSAKEGSPNTVHSIICNTDAFGSPHAGLYWRASRRDGNLGVCAMVEQCLL